jgi:hypothetical protein
VLLKYEHFMAVQEQISVFGGFTDHAQCILAIEGMTFMELESTGNLGFACGKDLNLRFKLRTAPPEGTA